MSSFENEELEFSFDEVFDFVYCVKDIQEDTTIVSYSSFIEENKNLEVPQNNVEFFITDVVYDIQGGGLVETSTNKERYKEDEYEEILLTMSQIESFVNEYYGSSQ